MLAHADDEAVHRLYGVSQLAYAMWAKATKWRLIVGHSAQDIAYAGTALWIITVDQRLDHRIRYLGFYGNHLRYPAFDTNLLGVRLSLSLKK